MTEIKAEKIAYEDVARLLQKAVEKKRDLHITLNSDGTVEIEFSIPSRFSTSTYSQPDIT